MLHYRENSRLSTIPMHCLLLTLELHPHKAISLRSISRDRLCCPVIWSLQMLQPTKRPSMSGSFKITDLHHPWTTIIIILPIQRQGLNILSSNSKTESLLLPLRESHNHRSRRSPPSMESRNLWRRLKLPWNLNKLSHYPRILPHSQARSRKPNSKTTWRGRLYRGQAHLICK